MADETPITASDIRFYSATAPQAARGLDALLDDIRQYIRRYVVVTAHQATAVALWTAHTHAIEAADCTPYLQITSATKRAGKTRLLEVLEPLVARPWFTGRTSAAALVRKVDAECPTLLLDESDAALGADADREYREGLRGILNSGYRRRGKSTVCIGQGANLQARDFSTFSAKAIAGIGELPGTVADRAIRIELRRRTSDEPCDRWRERDGHQQAAGVRDRLATWATQAVEILRDARPTPLSSLGDRGADVWEPLLAIADLAGGSWPHQARSAAIALAGSVEETDMTVELLRDVADILPECDGPIIATKDMLARLTELEERPWATWRHDKPITARGLARVLGPLGIHPDRHLRTVRGYRVDAFADALTRYLPSHASQRHNANDSAADSQISSRHNPSACDKSKLQFSADSTGVVTHGHMEPRDTGIEL